VIVEHNRLQALDECRDILDLVSVEEKFIAFGWVRNRFSGHNIKKLVEEFKQINEIPYRIPYCLVLDTVKGKGVSFYENRTDCHYRHPSDEELKLALGELK
jgi:transketolase